MRAAGKSKVTKAYNLVTEGAVILDASTGSRMNVSLECGIEFGTVLDANDILTCRKLSGGRDTNLG